MGQMTDIGEEVVVSSGVEEGEQCSDTVGFNYKPEADSKSGQLSG